MFFSNLTSFHVKWDTLNDKWIGGPLGSEEGFIQDTQFTNFSSSVAIAIEESGIWRPTGSYYATTNDLELTGSLTIKGNLRVEGTTTLIKNDSALNSLIVSGAMSVVKNQFASASISIENLGVLSDRMKNSVIDCGDGFF